MKTFARIGLLAFALCLAACGDDPQPGVDDIAAAEKLNGVPMTDAERELMLADIRDQRAAYDELHQVDVPNDIPPALRFDPGFDAPPPARPEWSTVSANDDTQEFAFLSVTELGALLRAGKVTSEQLTRYFLGRIRRHDAELHTMITVTEDLAIAEARRADRELQEGRDRGALHGIPYGLKDLVAVPGYPTTWGATPYRSQVIDEPATVAKRMEEAGAILLGKTAVGALAWGDVWFDAKTRTPWNTEVGASGSSAGSAAGVAAGFFPVAIGTETWGSILSPSIRNGVIGLRPTFGRVSRHGVMALSWSMDKVGAICRFAEDCGMVLDAIRGPDGEDRTVVEAGFSYSPQHRLEDMRVGFLADDFAVDDYPQRDADEAVLATLREGGIALQAVSLPDLPVNETMGFILSAEAATAFDSLTRSGRDDMLVRQQRDAWPNVFRAARFIPAVEYLQANRVRTRLVREMQDLFVENDIDVLLAPCFAGNQLLASNLSGHPSLVVPIGLDAEGMPRGFCLLARPFREGDLLTAARGIERITKHRVQVPPDFMH